MGKVIKTAPQGGGPVVSFTKEKVLEGGNSDFGYPARQVAVFPLSPVTFYQ